MIGKLDLVIPCNKSAIYNQPNQINYTTQSYYQINDSKTSNLALLDNNNIELELIAILFQAEQIIKSEQNVQQTIINIKQNIAIAETELSHNKGTMTLINAKCKELITLIEEKLLPADETKLEQLIVKIEQDIFNIEDISSNIADKILKPLSILCSIYETDNLSASIKQEVLNSLKCSKNKQISQSLHKYVKHKIPLEFLCKQLNYYRLCGINYANIIEQSLITINHYSQLLLCLQYMPILNNI
jgi:hypothetical protein